jgi:hypothetical protein
LLATKIAAALPPGAGQVTAVLDLLYKGLQYLSDKNNVTQLQALLKSSTSGVREIVDGVVDGKPGGLSQVSNATYDILEKATGPALSFVATQLGLENVRKELQNILENKLDLRSYVYVAAYKLAEKAKSFAGFGQLLPAPLSAKIPLSNGQKLWLMQGKDGKVHLVIGDPEDVPITTEAEKAAAGAGEKLAEAENKERGDIGRLANNPKDEQLVNEVKHDQETVKNLEQLATVQVESAKKDVAPKTAPGTKVYPDGSVRTPDGKFAGKTDVVPGTPGVVQAEAAINARPGWRVVGKEISVRDANGTLRRYDIVAQNPKGEYVGIEVKSGTATRTAQ